jgi:hypothetical protein
VQLVVLEEEAEVEVEENKMIVIVMLNLLERVLQKHNKNKRLKKKIV